MKYSGHGPGSKYGCDTETERVCNLPKPKHVGPLGLALHKAETPKKVAKKRERAY